MAKKGVFIGLLIVLVVLITASIYWWQKNNPAWTNQKSEKEISTPAKLEFEVKRSTTGAQTNQASQAIEAGETSTSVQEFSEEEISSEEIDQLEQEINQLQNDLNLEEEPEIDFNI